MQPKSLIYGKNADKISSFQMPYTKEADFLFLSETILLTLQIKALVGSHRVGHDWSNLAAAAGAELIYLYYYVTQMSINKNYDVEMFSYSPSTIIKTKKIYRLTLESI